MYSTIITLPQNMFRLSKTLSCPIREVSLWHTIPFIVHTVSIVVVCILKPQAVLYISGMFNDSSIKL